VHTDKVSKIRLSYDLFLKSIKVIQQHGIQHFLNKARAKIAQTSLQTETPEYHGPDMIRLHSSEKTEKWFRDNRDNFSNVFYVLLKFLLSLNNQLEHAAPISCSDYENYFKKHLMVSGFPFEIDFQQVHRQEDIIKFINEFDQAYLRKMIHAVFLPLIRFLIHQKGNINLLDVGTGATCGLFSKNEHLLFKEAKIDVGAVHFYGIDAFHKPSDAVFKKSTYEKCDILSFDVRKKFDLITGHHVLEHCSRWEEVIRHLTALLNPGGYLYFSFPRFGGFYDTAYRLMNISDHCADFDIGSLKSFSEGLGLEMCLSDIYVDPNNRFSWICNLYPQLADKEIADYFYDLCVSIDSKQLLGYHHYGYYMVFRRIAKD